MSKLNLKKAANNIGEENSISSQNAEYIIDKLSLKDLKQFLSLLKNAELKNKVVAMSSEKLTDTIRTMLSNKFQKKHIRETVDSSMGAGIKVKAYDMIYDLTVLGRLKQIALKIEDSL